MAMDLATVIQLVQSVSLLIGIVVALGTVRGRKNEQIIQMTNIQKDIEYIKEKLNGHDALRDISRSAEQSAKSAHKRLDDHLRQEHNKDIP